MSTVFDLKRKLDKFDVSDNVDTILKSKSKEVLDLQKDNMSLGLNNKGQVIGLYSEYTDKLASNAITIATGTSPKKDKVAGQPYNLEWSGKLFDELFYKKSKSYLSFDSKSSTKDKLLKTIKKHGFVQPKSIFGLPEKSEDVLNYEIIMPDLKKSLNEALL